MKLKQPNIQIASLTSSSNLLGGRDSAAFVVLDGSEVVDDASAIDTSRVLVSASVLML